MVSYRLTLAKIWNGPCPKVSSSESQQLDRQLDLDGASSSSACNTIATEQGQAMIAEV